MIFSCQVLGGAIKISSQWERRYRGRTSKKKWPFLTGLEDCIECKILLSSRIIQAISERMCSGRHFLNTSCSFCVSFSFTFKFTLGHTLD